MSKDEGDNSSLNSLSSLTRNEDESATTTSTESDTFESWTLITEKQRPKKNTAGKPIEQKDATIDEENMNDIPVKTSTEHDKEVEEFSDGISIISESSESVERFSPHPLLREQLHNMLPEEPLPALFTQSNIYSRIEPLDGLDTDEDRQSTKEPLRRRKPSVSTTDSALQQTHENKNETTISSVFIHPLIKRGVSALFYAGVTLALLSFWGRLSNPEWGVSSGTSLAEFEQKINNLELQQNLMFAEIDLLNKQVKYLTDLSSTAGPAGKYEQKPGKKFKAWAGNGKNLDPVEINKEDLKRAYKCGEDGKFVEIGGVCVDKDTVAQEVLVDQVGNVVNDMLQDSETYKSFEKVAEAFLSKGNEADMLPPTEAAAADAEPKYTEYAETNRKPYGANSKEYKNKFEGQPKKAYPNFKKHSNERENDSHEDDDDDDDNDDDSKEHKYEKYIDNSKERYNKQNKYKKSKENRYNSKERFDNKKQRKPSSSEERVDKSKDPYWHEKLMQQREELRRQRIHNNANNWYIERGDSREQARSS